MASALLRSTMHSTGSETHFKTEGLKVAMIAQSNAALHHLQELTVSHMGHRALPGILSVLAGTEPWLDPQPRRHLLASSCCDTSSIDPSSI